MCVFRAPSRTGRADRQATSARDLNGALARVIESTWTLLLQEIRGEAVVRGLQREDRLIYPKSAVREALVKRGVPPRLPPYGQGAWKYGSSTTGWSYPAPAVCPATSRSTTLSTSISRATRASSTVCSTGSISKNLGWVSTG